MTVIVLSEKRGTSSHIAGTNPPCPFIAFLYIRKEMDRVLAFTLALTEIKSLLN